MRASLHTGIAGLQWLFFLFANTVVVPISVGHALRLPPPDIAAGMQQAFVWTGIACLLQALIGHRYAIMEGPSALWWGFILSLAASAASMNIPLETIGGSLATGMLLAGAATVLMGVTGWGNRLKTWFTAPVLFVFFILLSMELSIVFFKSMFGIAESGRLDTRLAAISVIVVGVVLVLRSVRHKALGSFSILIGLAAGWALHAWLVPGKPSASVEAAFAFTWFPWGTLQAEPSIVCVAFLVGLINMSNIPATLKGADALFAVRTPESRYRGTFLVTGLMTMVSGLFGLVPYSPYASSFGFLESTGNAKRLPFALGAVLLVLVGFIPAFSGLLSHLPLSVGSAVLFAAYLNLFGSSLRQIEGLPLSSSAVLRLALPVLIGVALMNMPATAWDALPSLWRPLLGNGMLVGILLSIVLERTGSARRANMST